MPTTTDDEKRKLDTISIVVYYAMTIITSLIFIWRAIHRQFASRYARSCSSVQNCAFLPSYIVYRELCTDCTYHSYLLFSLIVFHSFWMVSVSTHRTNWFKFVSHFCKFFVSRKERNFILTENKQGNQMTPINFQRSN